MRVCVNRARCHKCGVCAAVCPRVFEMDQDHVARVRRGMNVVSLDGDTEEYCRYAASDCPAQAIVISRTSEEIQRELELREQSANMEQRPSEFKRAG